MATRPKSSRQIRLQVAHMAARLLAAEGMTDYLAAKRKAAARMGINNRQQLPSNQEIEQALIDYQRLFRFDSQPKLLQRMREVAVSAMQFLVDYQPRLAGPVADGTANEYSEIVLHLYSDSSEHVAITLMDNDIPYETCERRIRINAGTVISYPAYKLLADDYPVVLVVFPLKAKNQSPLSPADGNPMQRMSLRELQEILAADATELDHKSRPA